MHYKQTVFFLYYMLNRLLIENILTYSVSKFGDDTTFTNGEEYVNCLDDIRKCNLLLDAKYQCVVKDP